jgi:hypothetical protein
MAAATSSEEDLAGRLSRYVTPIVPKRDHVRYTNQISFKVCLLSPPLTSHPSAEIQADALAYEQIFSLLTPIDVSTDSSNHDLASVFSSPAIREQIALASKSHDTPIFDATVQKTCDGPEWMVDRRAVQWIKEQLASIRTAGGSTWEGRMVKMGGNAVENLGNGESKYL